LHISLDQLEFNPRSEAGVDM